MSEHFIKEIEIKNYKLFKDFKADGFGRVNLIGGKNNVGKTAFMEALFLVSNLKNAYNTLSENDKDDFREKLYFEIIKSFIYIKLNRFGNDFLIEWILDNYSLDSFSSMSISIPKYYLEAEDNFITPCRDTSSYKKWNDGSFKLFKHNENKYFYKLREKSKSYPNLDFFNFLTICNNNQNNIRKLLSAIKKDDKNEFVNKYLKNIFDVDKIDLTDDEVILIKNGHSYNISEFGDGIKSFINIILSLLYKKDRVVFIDEIENGIHYTNYDKLWELILKVSKEQNVQVFATTHSKEMIKSYARVAKKLEDDDIRFIEMGENKQNNIRAIVMDSNRFFRELEAQNEVRGW
jgi:AAA15 family ATPase/GTPase